MIAETRLLKRLEITQDLGIVPILSADEVAADIALTIDNEGLRPAGDCVPFGDRLFGIAHSSHVKVMLHEKAFIR